MKKLGYFEAAEGATIRDILEEECRKAWANPGQLSHRGRVKLVTEVGAGFAHWCAGEMG